MTKEQLAAQLDGMEYGSRISKETLLAARINGLVIVYGASDDLMELQGAIEEEIDAFEGTEILVTPEGLWDSSTCREKCRHYVVAEREAKARGATIQALWDHGDGYSWVYTTTIPHVTFEIVEAHEPYCRGIVFALSDVTPNR